MKAKTCFAPPKARLKETSLSACGHAQADFLQPSASTSPVKGKAFNGASDELENFICAEFVEHDIIFLSELISKMSIDIECPFCTSLLEQLMAIRRDLIKELRKM
ncbi:MAG TPA: hypothetical protein VI387_02850 [Candidatus Brocadiales bacterium]|nr:hypothetical protein [Candidatus Brocadiales bacterium]